MSNPTVFNKPKNEHVKAVFTDLFSKRGPSVVKSEQATTASTEIPAEKLKLMYEKAYKDGYARGMKEGRDAAILIAQQQLKHETHALRNLATSFQQAQQQQSDSAAQDLLSLALEVAKAMIKVELKIRPEAALPIIEEAIGMLPSIKKPLRLIVHPGDAAILAQHIMADLQELGWTMVEDDRIEPGGCRIETAVNTVDATIENRWMRISEALGRPNDWFETQT